MRKHVFHNQHGQTITEFLAILIVLIAIVLVHTQFSLNHVITSYLKYTTFMAARAEAVSGNSTLYTQALIGDSTQSRLRPLATIRAPEGGSYITPQNQFKIGYDILSYLPLFDDLAQGMVPRSSQSDLKREPGQAGPREFFDNEE